MSTAGFYGNTMITLPAGVSAIGSEGFYPEEAPVRRVPAGRFQMDRQPVSNR